ncbi:hypothetical protein DJ018_11065 [Phenylobacterium deserti]|uniref:histidine kinase n=2 Tax=Phenylobacterium deserti TaxID=1914756 RepID=A0A328AE00_9CAUL|nr:hypothetical protein DJ018_11065 [Phenylobacterium deserti]
MLNAAQAMAAQPGPKDLVVTIRAEGEMLRVDVRDNGPGIPPGQLGTIFDPFYSTKPGGMGMGLAICKTCVGAQGGRLWVASTPGEGSTFSFTVPTARAALPLGDAAE